MHDAMKTLPSGHADALRRELDENEQLLWAAVPVAWRVAIGQFLACVFLACIFGFAAVVCMVGTVEIWRELNEVRRDARVDPASSTYFRLLAVLVFCAGLSGVVIWLLLEAACILGRARRTVYAVTNTRILSLSFETSGLARCSSLEPRHPLALRRTENRDGSGTVLVHPSPSGETRSAGIALVGVPNPREVDRLIRKTFDPK